MTSLRMRVVEAGARAHHELRREHFHPDWPPYEELGDFGQESAREFMSAALDAMLDCLAAEAPTRDVSDLIWMLRDDPDDWRKYQGHVSPMPPSLRGDR